FRLRFARIAGCQQADADKCSSYSAHPCSFVGMTRADRKDEVYDGGSYRKHASRGRLVVVEEVLERLLHVGVPFFSASIGFCRLWQAECVRIVIRNWLAR